MLKVSVWAVVFIIITTPQIFSQNDSLRNQIIHYEQSKHEFLDRGRRMLLDNFENNNIEKTKKIKDLLLEENNRNVYDTFYPIEYICLLYWTEEYDVLIDFVKQVDFLQHVSNAVAMLARIDNLYPTLFEKTIQNKELLEISINNSLLSEMDKDFLRLQLDDLLRIPQNGRIDPDAESTKKINDLADIFLSKYPKSPYDTIVRETIRYKFEPLPWGGFCDIGLGAAITQGSIHDYLNTGPMMDMLIGVRYKKTLGMLGFGFSGHELRQNIDINNTIWKEESSSTQGFVYFNGGYMLHESKRFSIYPFTGIGYGGFSAIQKDIDAQPELKHLHLNSFFTQIGIALMIKFKVLSPYLLHSTSEKAFSQLGLRYSFRMPYYENKRREMDGFFHCLTLSWGIGGRRMRRVK